MALTALNFKIDLERYAPTRARLWRIVAIWASVMAAAMLAMTALALAGRSEAVIGGDFMAFYAAAGAAWQGAPAAIYDPAYFQSLLQAAHPNANAHALTWQYPPTYLLLIAPLAALPYYIAYFFWSTATAVGYYAAARKIIRDRLILFAVIAGPAAYVAYVTGQNGFLTAMLLLIAAVFPNKRPVLAGLAAGLLTVKPQLGLLIPIAYLAAGCWRAMAVAALTASLLAFASFAAFGAEPWFAFAAALSETSSQIAGGAFPLAKMTTPFSAALFAGAPVRIANLVFAASLGFCVAFVWLVWRRIDDPLTRAAALVACVLMAAPYGFYYELIILALPGAVIVMRGLERGWLAYERPLLGAAYILPLLVSTMADFRQGVSPGFIAVLIIFGLTVRRVAHEAPDLFRLKRNGALSLPRLRFLRRDNQARRPPARPETSA